MIPVKYAGDGSGWIDQKVLEENIFGTKIPESEEWRRYYGRAITPATIEQVIRLADFGYMRDLTDLEYETVFSDPHLASLLLKRFPALASCNYTVMPAKGPGLDPKRADFAAELVRNCLASIPNLKQNIVRLSWGHFYGRACLEKKWSFQPGSSSGALKWKIESLNWIHPRRLSFGPERELRLVDGIYQMGYFQPVGFDLRSIAHKWLSFCPQLFNDYPEREGIGPKCLYFSYFKRFGVRERMILTELFGKPWRIVETEKDAIGIGPEALDRAQEAADKLGASNSAAFDAGMHLRVAQPINGAGEVHKDVIAYSDDSLSKLVLGQTRTTDAKSGALGSSADATAANEQDLIIQSDGWNVSEALTEGLSKDIIELNMGAEWLAYAPQIVINTERPIPRAQQIDGTVKALGTGIKFKSVQVYERLGFDKPGDDDETIQQTGGVDAMGNPLGGQVTVSSPKQPAASLAVESPTMPKPEPSPPSTSEPARVTSGPPMASPGLTSGGVSALLATIQNSALSVRRYDGALFAVKQPSTINGSPERLIDTGVAETARITASWGNIIGESTEGLTDPSEIFNAINEAANALPLAAFARVAERKIFQGVMLGSLDSVFERENEEAIALEHFAAIKADILMGEQLQMPFVDQPFDKAVRAFKSRDVLHRDLFEQLSSAAKHRSFTVAKLARTELLADVHAELARQIASGRNGILTGEGPRLSDFKKFMAERIESAGWTPANASHVETIFRTNVMDAYGQGRKSEMRQPSVLASRPVWQYRCVGDSRTRAPHKEANGLCMLASDPAWENIYPPCGYNCRCRVISRSQHWADANSITMGRPPLDLPDEGWSGSGAMMGEMEAE